MIIAGSRNLYKDDCSGLRKPAVPRDYSCGTYQVRNDEIKRLEEQEMALGGFELTESGDAPTLEQRRAARRKATYARPQQNKARQRAGKSGKPRRRKGA